MTGILFREDWDRYPNAIPDLKTRNKTFLEFSSKLRHVAGVKNCLFPLQLHNRDLQGIDPFRMDLDIETQVAMAMEIHENPWYFWRECLIIPPQTGIKGNQFRLNRANCSLYWSYLQHLMYFLVQPRQTGKSTAGDGILDWLTYGRYFNSTMAIVTNTDKTRSDNAKRLRDVKEYLPPWFIALNRLDSMTGELVTYNARNNRVRLLVGAADEAGAYRVGRGASTITQQWDEFPYIRQNKIAYQSGVASTNAVHEQAEAIGEPYGIFITTTAGRQDNRDGKFAYGIYSDAARWADNFYDAKDREEVVRLVKANRRAESRMVIVQGTFSHTQVGVTDQKHYDNMVKSGAEGMDADMDYFNIWPTGGSSNVFDQATKERFTRSKRDVVYTEPFTHGFIVHWYLPMEEVNRRAAELTFVIGSDTSEGGGNDGLSLVFTDYTTLEVLGVAVVNEVLLPRYGDFLFEILMKYRRSVLIPERKSTGQTFIDYLCIRLHAVGVDPFTRIYNTIVDEGESNVAPFMEIRNSLGARDDAFYISRKTKFGFCTGATTRKTLYNVILKIAATKAGHCVRDSQLIAELLSLEKKGDRIDHPADGHDDTVIAWLLGVYLLVYGRNLHYYGIDRSLLMSRVVSDSPDSPEEEARQDMIDALNSQVDDCIEILQRTDNPMLVQKYQSRLENLHEELESYGVQGMNISQLIEEINERKRRQYQRQ